MVGVLILNGIAIGNPYGLDNTMTTGIVSQTSSLLSESAGFSILDAIQTDAPINPGILEVRY